MTVRKFPAPATTPALMLTDHAKPATPMSPTPDPVAQSTGPSSAVFDRAAAAILGTMVTLIVMLTVLLVAESLPSGPDPASTAQGSVSPHRA